MLTGVEFGLSPAFWAPEDPPVVQYVTGAPESARIDQIYTKN